jgi:hypothetical protein
VIVNASLGWRQTRLATSCRNFRRRCFALEIKQPQKIYAGPGPRLEKNSHVELLRDCECVPRGVARQTRLAASCRNFERRWFAWAQRSIPGQAASLKKNHEELLRDCECVPPGSGARLGCNELQNFRAALVRVEWAPQRSIRTSRVTQKKNHGELLRDCECVAGVATRRNEPQRLRRCFSLEWHRRSIAGPGRVP